MIRLIVWMLPGAAVFWLVALVGFVHSMPRTPVGDSITTDAIVVLTGGSLRVSYGFELFDKDKAKQLFITGVDDATNIEELMEVHYASDKVHRAAKAGAVVVLDYEADSTHTNAIQTAKWARPVGVRSIRLVTANYHLPRSLIEFRRTMPDVVIVPDPVFPENFHLDRWWHDGVSRELVLSEFHKYIVVWLSAVLL